MHEAAEVGELVIAGVLTTGSWANLRTEQSSALKGVLKMVATPLSWNCGAYCNILLLRRMNDDVICSLVYLAIYNHAVLKI